MARIVVTGAAGFIGSKVCELLLRRGDIVVGVDNLDPAYDVRVKHWRLSQLAPNEDFEVRYVDISDTGALRTLFSDLRQPGQGNADGGIAAVINLAARAGVRASVEDPWSFYRANVLGTLNLLELCREFGIPKFVQASSSSVYGACQKQPFREDMETDGPLSPYAATKKAAELLCSTYHTLHGLDVSVLRYFTVYGPAGRPDMSVFRFIKWTAEGEPLQVYGDGSQRRDFTYVEDIAQGTLAALKPLGFAVINLGGNSPVGLMELIATIEGMVGHRAAVTYLPPQKADVPATWASIERASELLGWTPLVPLEAGVRKAVAWYLEHREWARLLT